MSRLYKRGAAMLLYTVLLLQLGRIDGTRPRKPVRPKAYVDEPLTSDQNLVELKDAATGSSSNRRRAQGFSVEKKIVSDYHPQFATNNVCSRAFSVIPHDLVRGNNNMAALDSKGAIQECILTNHPGLWYSVNGTGQVLKASILTEQQQSNNDNNGNPNNNATTTTQLAIFRGDYVYDGGCDSLQCVKTGAPTLTTSGDPTTSTSESSSGWTTYWSTEPGATYYLYAYGMGSFQMMLTEQTRPENDTPVGALEIQVGDSMEGSTAYASRNQDIVVCNNNNNNNNNDNAETLHSGVWFQVQGTGSPLQAQLKTVVDDFVSQVSIYSRLFDCVEQVENHEFYNLGSAAWYPISSAAVWDSVQGETYYILVQGALEPENYEAGMFELTVLQDSRPDNNHCSLASELSVGQRVAGSTKFATMNGVLRLCSQSGTAEETLTAPGVWYLIRNIQGQHQVSLSSAYSAAVTVFVGDHCSNLSCMDGSNNLSLDFASSAKSASNTATWAAKDNETYYVLVHGKDSMVGTFDISVGKLSEASTEDAGESATDNLYSIEIPVSLSFGFFPDSARTFSSPNPDELIALMEQVDKFYSKTIKGTLGAQFIRFEAKLTNTTVDEDDVLPVMIQFTAKVALLTSSASPSSGTILNIMHQANYQEFIRDYVWQSDPVGANPFFQTLRVEFENDKTVAIEEHDLDAVNSASHGEDVQRIDAKAKMSFGFLPDAELRQPTEVEVDGLIEQTNSFYSKVLTEEFDTFVRLGITATGGDFIAEAQFPVTISLDIHAFFTMPHLKNSTSDLLSAADIMDVIQNVKLADFIQDYVWESEPFSVSLFYETRHVALISTGLEQPVEVVAPTEEGQLRKMYMHAVLYFNFHETATQTLREPSEEEVDGLLNKTESFFKEMLENELPSTSGFANLHVAPARVEYKELDAFPVAIYTRIEVSLRENSDASIGLSADQLMDLLLTADMRDYVKYYAWFSQPLGSIFFAADQAVLEPYDPLAVSALTPSTTAELYSSTDTIGPSSTTTVAPGEVTIVPVEADVVAKFTFFRTNYESYRVATEPELAALTAQTKVFFSKILQDKYEDLVQLDLSLITAGFADNSDKPSVVAWKVNALFYVLDGTSATRTPENLLAVLTSSDELAYLHKYVWSADPIGSNLFFEADAVQFEQPGTESGRGSDTSSILSESSASPPAANELSVHVSILYGFLEDQEITRKPSANEQETILYQTTLFFNTLYRQEFGASFKKATLTITDVTLIDGDKLPLIITYEISAEFVDATSIPTAEDLSQAMDNANFESYIEFYVWNADSSANSMFYDTQHVVFQANIDNNEGSR